MTTHENGSPDFQDAIAHCLASPNAPSAELRQLVADVLGHDDPSADAISKLHQRARALNLPQIALVYGGATRVKGYVFEAPRLPEIRGASALLDYVGSKEVMTSIWREVIRPPDGDDAAWIDNCIIYASGGNVLGFAPADKGEAIARAIERCYNEHTLTANSIAVAACFDLVELRYGRLCFDEAGAPRYWVEQFRRDWNDPVLQRELAQYYYLPPGASPDDTEEAQVTQRFFNRKSFGELVTLLSTQFYRRRDTLTPPGQGYALLPWAEKCDSSDVRPAQWRGRIGDDDRELSEASARKRYVGQIVKQEKSSTKWHEQTFDWRIPPELRERSWESQWRKWIDKSEGGIGADSYYAQAHDPGDGTSPPRDLGDIGAAHGAKGYIGIIYADGNNVARMVATLQTPDEYSALSCALDTASKDAVFAALGNHLTPATIRDPRTGEEQRVHPFEILTIGGDDLLIIVPGNAACDIAADIGHHFEQTLAEQFAEHPTLRAIWQRQQDPAHADQAPASDRYTRTEEQRSPDHAPDRSPDRFQGYQPPIGLSAGLIIAQDNTPIFFLRDLVEQLQKNAKKLARTRVPRDHQGTLDFMVLKSITMVSDTINAFREEALGTGEESIRRLTARPYTWHEFAGLVQTVRALKAAGFPKSQIARLRQQMLDEQSTTILTSTMEYLYTGVRLRGEYRNALREHVERAWQGRSPGQHTRTMIGPWLPVNTVQWETIWADLSELYDMVEPVQQPNEETAKEEVAHE
jgi:CRISPR-associated protein Cmr2